jgi:hypothetical protein
VSDEDIGGKKIRTNGRVLVAAMLTLLVFGSFAAVSLLPRGEANGVAAPSEPANSGSSVNLLQYEWPQIQRDPSFAHFSAGPAPEAPDIMWKTNITNLHSYVSAFDGEIFVMAESTVFALDWQTGDIVWSTEVPAPGPWPEVFKIDDSHMVVGSSCLDPTTGRILWTSSDFSASPDPLFSDNVCSPEEQMFYTKVNSYVQAWNFSDPPVPPTLAWSTFIP